jgi:hypothetical protein
MKSAVAVAAAAAVGRTDEVAELTTAMRTVEMIPSSHSEGATGVLAKEVAVVAAVAADEVARTVVARAIHTGIDCQHCLHFGAIF